ncbi:MAG: hypothetical protein L0177_09770 [Chloroflexi bacterium]|nr:hypothetical protein [Chloroflexota bacterium]
MLKPFVLIILVILALGLAGCASSPEASDAPSDAAAPSAADTGNDVSDIAYGFTLPNATGLEQSLASYRGTKNVVVVFYRAFW